MKNEMVIEVGDIVAMSPIHFWQVMSIHGRKVRYRAVKADIDYMFENGVMALQPIRDEFMEDEETAEFIDQTGVFETDGRVTIVDDATGIVMTKNLPHHINLSV